MPTSHDEQGGAAAPPDELRLDDVATALDVHYMTVYRYVRTGRLPAHKREGVWRVRPDDLAAFRDAGPPDTGSGSIRGAPTSKGGPARLERLYARVVAGDEAGAWSLLEDALVHGLDPSDVHHELLVPALHRLGADWHAGTIDVADEHLATATIRRLVARLGPRFATRGRSRGTAIVGGAPGERHDVGLSILADLVRAANVTVIDLGGDVPAASFRLAVERADRPLACLVGASSEVGRRALPDLAEALASTGVPVVLGGPATDRAAADTLGWSWAADYRDAVALVLGTEASGAAPSS